MKFGNITKSLNDNSAEITDDMLAKINLYTRKALTADEVYIFPIVMCDNEIDRDYEHFTANTIKDFAEMFKGKTVICDHNYKNANQCARIFDTEVIHNPTVKTFDGQDLYQLKAFAYMLRNDANAEIIANIDAGIYKEVSVGCSVKSATCSICHNDYNDYNKCRHWAGYEYDDGKICNVALDGAKDAYELSFVAVPAQSGAMVTKSKCYDGDDTAKKERKSKMNYEDLKKELSAFSIELDSIAKAKGEVPEMSAVFAAIKAKYDDDIAAGKLDKSVSVSAEKLKAVTGKDMTADEVCDALSKSAEFEKKAELYDGIKSKAVENACKMGIKAKGESFDEERYKKLFAGFSVDEINGQAKDWEDEAKSLFKSGRKSENEDNEKSYIKPNLNF